MVRDIRQRKATIKSTNITGLLMPTTEASLLAPVIAAAKVRPNGWPVISLTNGQTLTFDAELDSWTQISSIWWAKGSDCWESAGRVRGSTLNAGRGAVKLLEAETNDWLQAQSGKKAASVINQANSHPTTSHDTVDVDVVAASETEVIQGEEKTQLGDDDDWKTALTLGHLEARMHAAIVLDSLMEYKSFLGQYAKKLAEEAFRGKAEELCKELLGPVYLCVHAYSQMIGNVPTWLMQRFQKNKPC
ncbi:HIR complex subunit [Cystobasidiomycetes sp. EMM_F5]